MSYIKQKDWNNIFTEKKGDLYNLEEKIKDAINNWEKSIKYQTNKETKKIIKMKINYLKK